MSNLEKKSSEPFEYNFTDLIILGKPLRHIPKIMKEPDKVVRGYEFLVMGALVASQACCYYFGPQLFLGN
ncbi:MAG: hypothetical protein Q8P15_02740 [Nanoarchaeota archaeon]|nr:hypothetical protein [Nanoarchaeota archaeon]